MTLVFVFSGNAFQAANPGSLTAGAAAELARHGDRAVQLATPTINSVAAFDGLAREILSISRGQPIGLMGFSAGGALATRLAGVQALNVKAVMNFYGPPDLKDWLNYHQGDHFYQVVTGENHFSQGIIDLLSGPNPTRAFVVNAFGQYDANIVASVSTASFVKDFRFGQVFTYPGGHGVYLNADPAAFEDFVQHL